MLADIRRAYLIHRPYHFQVAVIQPQGAVADALHLLCLLYTSAGNQIRFPIVLCQLHDAVANGFLPGFAAGNDVLELCDVVLPCICPNRFMPSINADQTNGIDLRVLLKGLQRVR